MAQITQLPLAVHLPDDETFDSFFIDLGSSLVVQLKSFIEDNNSPRGFYLFGQAGVGKSHLLHASCAYAEKHGLTSLCLSLSELTNLDVSVLDGLENIDLICLDDLHLIANNQVWQQGVFDLYNRVLEQDKRILISGNDSAKQLKLSLPDLISRLSWGMTEQAKPLAQNQKLQALQYRAKLRGLELSDDAAKYLLNHISRGMTNLIDSLNILDTASISQQRKLTIPFIKEVLF